MSAEWITFETLRERVPGRSESTWRRMIAERQISSRQRMKGGKREFFWPTIQRELAGLEKRSRVAEREPDGMQVLLEEFRKLNARLDRLETQRSNAA